MRDFTFSLFFALVYFFSWCRGSHLENGNLPPSNAEVNAWNYTPISPYIFLALCLVKHRNKFTFALQKLINFARYCLLLCIYLKWLNSPAMEFVVRMLPNLLLISARVFL